MNKDIDIISRCCELDAWSLFIGLPGLEITSEGIFWIVCFNSVWSVQSGLETLINGFAFPSSLSDSHSYIILLSRQMVRTQFAVQFPFTAVFSKQHGEAGCKRKRPSKPLSLILTTPTPWRNCNSAVWFSPRDVRKRTCLKFVLRFIPDEIEVMS